MAFLFGDTYDHYSASADVLKKWTSGWASGNASDWTVLPATSSPPGGGNVLRITTGNRGVLYDLGATAQTLIMGGWVYFETLPSTGGPIFALVDTATEQVSVRGNGVGKLTVTRNGTVLATSTLSVIASTWYHLEFKAKIDPSTGTYDVKVDGVSYISGTGANTRASANSFATGAVVGNPSATIQHKHTYILDTTGSVANDMIGPCRMAILRPVAAGNYAQFTGNGGPNFANVADAIADGDQTFNQSATANQIDTFVMQDLPASAGTVFGIQHVLQVRQDGGAARTIAALQRSGGTDYVATTKSASGTYRFITDPKSINPATAAGYTVSDVNGLEAGYKLIS